MTIWYFLANDSICRKRDTNELTQVKNWNTNGDSSPRFRPCFCQKFAVFTVIESFKNMSEWLINCSWEK